jgi:hypothetical protein
MQHIYGDFDDLDGHLSRLLRITYHPERAGLQWNHCSLTADFLSHYYAVFFPRDGDRGELVDRGDMRHSISYLMNELVENAVKFRAGGDVQICGGFHADDLVFLTMNQIDRPSEVRFRSLLEEITSGDPQQRLLARIEHNAMTHDSKASGLGLLTLMSDYQARLGWRFEAVGHEAGLSRLITMARLLARRSA